LFTLLGLWVRGAGLVIKADNSWRDERSHLFIYGCSIGLQVTLCAVSKARDRPWTERSARLWQALIGSWKSTI